MRSKVKTYTLFGLTLVVTTLAILGVATGLILTDNRGPGRWPQLNHFQTVWYCLVLSFVGIQSIIIQATPDIESGPSKAMLLVDGIYYVFIMVLSLIHCISWAVFGRVDLALITAFTIIVASINTYIQSYRFEKASLANVRNSSKPASLKPLTRKVATGLNSILKVLFLVICVLLSFGAIVHSFGSVQYPIIPGKYLTYSLADASTQTIYYRCEGNTTDLPTIIFESDGSHGLGDWLGILNAMDGRHRICVWDKPGLGFSDYMRYDQAQPEQFYHELIQALVQQEPDFDPPFAFVGWGGGLGVVYKYALDHPENVHALINLDGALDAVEFRLPSVINNWTESQAQEQFETDMKGRFQSFYIINGLGVPFGLVPFFLSKVGVNDQWPPRQVDEQAWYFGTEKTWITQYWYARQISRDPPNLFEENISAPVHMILTHQSDDQIDGLVCQPRNLNPDECQFQKDYNRMIYEEKLANFPRNGGKTVECTMDDCNLGYYIFNNPAYTIETVLSLLN